MADAASSDALCPPHYWLITAQPEATAGQVWVCRRCEARKEVSAADLAEAARQPPYSSRATRPPQRDRPARPDDSATEQ